MNWFRLHSGTGSLMSLVLLLGASQACTTGHSDFIQASHYTFPNSNVVPMGTVSGKVSKWTLFSAKLIDETVAREAIYEALRQKGGNMLINYTASTTTTAIPIPPIFLAMVFRTVYTVEGMACTVDTGRQFLDADPLEEDPGE